MLNDYKRSDNGSVIRRDRLIAVIVIALWFLIFCFLAMQGISPRPFSVVNCTRRSPIGVQSSDGHFIDNQIVVIGAAQAVAQVVSQVPTITQQPLENCSLNYAGQVPELATAGAANNLFRREDLSSLSVRLYQVDPGTTVTEAVAAVNRNGAGRVFADPNYLTEGMLDVEACGNPNSTGGSPNSTGGSPNSTGGSTGGPLGEPASAGTYANQWAFEHIGLGPALQSAYEVAQVNYQGNRIRVGVFDTSPYTLTEVLTGTQTGAQTGTSTNTPSGTVVKATEPITWVTPEFTLTVNLLLTPTQSVLGSAAPSSSPSISTVHVFTDVSDHGLFVAGMVHAVAPQSDIQLYQVLDQYGCGDLYTLVTQLNTFISQVEADRQTGLVKGAVINLSLGVLRPRASDAVTNTITLSQTGDIVTYTLTLTPDDELKQAYASLLDDPVNSLLFTLHAADRMNIPVVAAAGNDSWRDEYQTQPLAPQLPAAYPFVIGVAGSNANRQRSCFSNWGDVSAPAGEGGPGTVLVVSSTNAISTPTPAGVVQSGPAQSSTPQVVSSTTLISVTSNCAASFDTPLVGPVRFSARYGQGYATWNGTSFATPLVSGLAALVLEADAQPNGASIKPEAVARAIKCGAAAADGVINVPVTLMRCLGP